MQANRYTVNVPPARPGDEPTLAVEWNWDGKRTWTMSSRDEGEVRWFPAGPLSEVGRQALLGHFWLEHRAKKRSCSLQRIFSKSPFTLAVLGMFDLTPEKFRSHKSYYNPVSDRVGDRHSALRPA